MCLNPAAFKSSALWKSSSGTHTSSHKTGGTEHFWKEETTRETIQEDLSVQLSLCSSWWVLVSNVNHGEGAAIWTQLLAERASTELGDVLAMW